MSRHELSLMEQLECRWLMSATARVHRGALLVNGTKGPDAVTVSESNGDIVVMNGSDQLISTPASGFGTVRINGKGGGDTITIDSSFDSGDGLPLNLDITDLGNGGNTINVEADTFNENARIRVGNGANAITTPSDSWIHTGNGNDTISASGGTGLTIIGTGTGDQSVTLGDQEAGVYYRGDGTLTVGDGGDTIFSGNAPDTIATSGTEQVFGGVPEPTLFIYAGPQTVVMGSPNDEVFTGKDRATNVSGASELTKKDHRPSFSRWLRNPMAGHG